MIHYMNDVIWCIATSKVKKGHFRPFHHSFCRGISMFNFTISAVGLEFFYENKHPFLQMSTENWASSLLSKFDKKLISRIYSHCQQTTKTETEFRPPKLILYLNVFYTSKEQSGQSYSFLQDVEKLELNLWLSPTSM